MSSKHSLLDKSFFERSVVTVARELLGTFLVSKIGKREVALMITETEAYDGLHDRASHASKGRTARTEVMFGEAGVWYVYFVYGMYDMLNIVTGPKDYPAAVLIRGIEGINGPGKLTRELKITRALNKKPATIESGLWLEDRCDEMTSHRIPKGYKIERAKRIGVAYAGEWAKKPWRFVLKKEVRQQLS